MARVEIYSRTIEKWTIEANNSVPPPQLISRSVDHKLGSTLKSPEEL
jgi:hypothetical protein